MFDNTDSMTWQETEQRKDEEDDEDEIETELEWRKMRHERELFLQEVKSKNINLMIL